ncbi:MAG: zf-TFIIB domain-containing protein [Gammaproteobacteria bacterium]|nr:zf-TFIIB domain-containing protein [Gammaproteobacteria bacterium]
MLKLEKSKLNVPRLIAEADGTTSKKRKCASCSNQPLKLINTNGIEIDACERCAGIYLDEGEVRILLPKACEPKEDDLGKVAATTEGLLWVVLAFFSGGC